jgi:hypothetical protein
MENWTIKQAKNITIEKQKDGSSVVFDEEGGNVHILNSTALIIYNLCTNKSITCALSEFIELFDISNQDVSKEIESDFFATIESMLSKGLLLRE